MPIGWPGLMLKAAVRWVGYPRRIDRLDPLGLSQELRALAHGAVVVRALIEIEVAQCVAIEVTLVLLVTARCAMQKV